MPKHLVTGGTGFTGYNLVKRLAQMGEDVIALDIKDGFKDRLDKLGVKVVIGSANDESLIDTLMDGVDYVHHVAAAFRQINLPDKVYWDANVESNRVLITAAKKHGIKRYILTSTGGVHGHIENPPANENAPISTRDYYQLTKYEGEKLARKLCDEYNIPYVVIRPAPIYGPADTRILLLFKSIKSGKFFMLGSGNVHYHLIFIDNLVDAYLLSMEKDAAVGQTYIIADSECLTLNELVRTIAESLNVPPPRWHFPVKPVWLAGYLCELICNPLGIEPPLFRRRVDFFMSERSFDISKAKKELGYNPGVGAKEGVEITAKWYQENGYL
jgi:nucleoside-diphosphate-sugar epimerase